MKRSLTITLFVCLCALFFTAQAFAEGQQGAKVGEFLKVSELMDKNIKDQQGQEVGTVKDVLVSEQGEAKYLILSKEDKMIPVPWEAANLQVQQDEITAQLDEQRLANAPSFQEGEWPQFESNYEQQIHSYYGTEMRQPGMQPGMQPGIQPETQPGMQPGVQQERETPRQ
jgi:sporulation protein YlmC with PRC-barrel domain